ncbi:hypothetical protein PVL29_023388 [Vitis rotundifolia]|uniref:Thioredoxin domain-containing protein n=1 Tax=Vitis rotundifolia TaxID=103349 RepID=A0AA39D968_VITRO|nr:hypothetical protein PVL29_023388 [Vitis rotundifolia]
MTKCSVDSELSCSLMGGIFQRRSFWPKKTSVRPLPTNSNSTLKVTSPSDSKGRHGGSRETASLNSSSPKPPPKLDEKLVTTPNLVHSRPSTSSHKSQGARPSDAARNSSSSSATSSLKQQSQSQELADMKRLRREPYGLYTEPNRASTDHHQFYESKALVPTSSGNVMPLGHLGNLKPLRTGNSMITDLPDSTNKTQYYHQRKLSDSRIGSNGVMGNITRKPSNENPKSGSRFLGLLNKLDPEALKSMGNEEYKQGRFKEALELYNQAIALNANKASYHSNKSAALIGLGHLMEAPSYHRAHHRLATLYLRLGEAEKALNHYKYSSPADSEYIAKAQALQTHLSRCIEARNLRDWNTLLKEARCAISSGADSAPQIYAFQAEALLKLHRHQEAYATFRKGPKFQIDSCTQFFGPAASAYMLIIQAQLYMTMGRLEDAVALAQKAARLDSSNNEVTTVLRRVLAVESARLRGNQLFNASKLLEACVTYNEGLDHDPYNTILLCNRAACRSKLGQFEKAVEDCTMAIIVQPSYSKARLRRANCNAKMERWEASIQDYEMLIRETPGDEEVGRALFEAKIQLKKQRGEDIKDMKFGSNLVFISNNESFRHFVTSPGMSVVLFCNKTSHKQVLQLLEQVCKRYPSVYFLKVEVEDHPYLAKSESVSSVPAFKIYKNGSRVKEIPGNNRELLESSIKLYSS